jgi:hypothetical protein
MGFHSLVVAASVLEVYRDHYKDKFMSLISTIPGVGKNDVDLEKRAVMLLMAIMELDPTQVPGSPASRSLGSYVRQIINWFYKSCDKNDVDTTYAGIVANQPPWRSVRKLLEEYSGILKMLPQEKKSISAFKTVEDFIEFMRGDAQELVKKAMEERLSKETKVLYEDDLWLVVSPLSWDAAKYLGEGSEWCTSLKTSSNFFNRYTSWGTLVMFLRKDKRELSYQAVFPDTKKIAKLTKDNRIPAREMAFDFRDYDDEPASYGTAIPDSIITVLEEAGLRTKSRFQPVFTVTSTNRGDSWLGQVRVPPSNSVLFDIEVSRAELTGVEGVSTSFNYNLPGIRIEAPGILDRASVLELIGCSTEDLPVALRSINEELRGMIQRSLTSTRYTWIKSSKPYFGEFKSKIGDQSDETFLLNGLGLFFTAPLSDFQIESVGEGYTVWYDPSSGDVFDAMRAVERRPRN